MNYYLDVLKKYTQFSGRARRKEFWMFSLVSLIIYFALSFIGSFIWGESPMAGSLGGIYYLGVIIPSIAVSIRRMHDVGKSGWFILIPIYNLVLYCRNGAQGENEYGPDPKR